MKNCPQARGTGFTRRVGPSKIESSLKAEATRGAAGIPGPEEGSAVSPQRFPRPRRTVSVAAKAVESGGATSRSPPGQALSQSRPRAPGGGGGGAREAAAPRPPYRSLCPGPGPRRAHGKRPGTADTHVTATTRSHSAVRVPSQPAHKSGCKSTCRGRARAQGLQTWVGNPEL